MDFDLVPQLIIIFSLAGILAIVGRNFSKVKEATREEIFLEESVKEKEEKEKFLYLYERAVRRVNKENYQKRMADFWVWFEKFLRKLRIIVLKLDSRMVAMLEQLRKKNVESIENWKKMAERNVRKSSKEVEGLSEWMSGRNTSKKHRKMQEMESATTEERAVNNSNSDTNSAISDLSYAKVLPSAEVASNMIVEPTVIYSEAVLHEENVLEEEENAQIDSCENEKRIVDNEETAEVITEEVDTESDFKEEDSVEESELIKPAEVILAEAEAAIEIDREDLEVIADAEEEKARTKKEQECIEILMKNPADIKAYWRLGLIYSKRRNYEDALACFRQIVKIDPTYTKAKQKAIELMEKMKKRGR